MIAARRSKCSAIAVRSYPSRSRIERMKRSSAMSRRGGEPGRRGSRPRWACLMSTRSGSRGGVTVVGRVWDPTRDFGWRPLRISGGGGWGGGIGGGGWWGGESGGGAFAPLCGKSVSVFHGRDERQPRLEHGGHRNLVEPF